MMIQTKLLLNSTRESSKVKCATRISLQITFSCIIYLLYHIAVAISCFERIFCIIKYHIEIFSEDLLSEWNYTKIICSCIKHLIVNANSYFREREMGRQIILCHAGISSLSFCVAHDTRIWERVIVIRNIRNQKIPGQSDPHVSIQYACKIYSKPDEIPSSSSCPIV